MIRSIFTVMRNMNILQKKQENTSANVANINTPGYKFQDIIQSTLEAKEMVNYSGGNKMNQRQELGNFIFGNQIDESYRDFGQGSLYETNKLTDFAIIGEGFFTVIKGNGEIVFTRNGNFRVNEEKQLTTMEGFRVLGLDDAGGETYIYVDNDNLSANLLIADFDDYEDLSITEDGYYASGEAFNTIDGEIRQGYLEMSNVKIADEMIKMIEISREFESNQKLLHAADETLDKAVNEIGKV